MIEIAIKTPWDDLPRPEFRGLDGNTHFRFTIIGGGFTGIALAYHLSRLVPGNEIGLIEAEGIGSGASGRTGGILMNGTASDDFPGTSEAISSLSRTIQREGIDCDLRLNGCYELERAREDGAKPHFFDHGPLVPTQVVEGGDFHPLKYLYPLAKKVACNGVTLFEKSRIVEVKNKPLEVITPHGVIRTDWLIATTNTNLHAQLKLEGILTPYQTYALASEPIAKEKLAEIGWEDEFPFYTLSLPFLWGRTTTCGRIIIGSGLSPIKKIKAEMLEQLEERFHSLHPALEGVKIEYRWWGPISIPHDWIPKILNSPLHPHILYVGGYAGHGCTLSHLFAERIAPYLAGDEKGLEELVWARAPQGTPLDRTFAKIALKVASNFQ